MSSPMPSPRGDGADTARPMISPRTGKPKQWQATRTRWIREGQETVAEEGDYAKAVTPPVAEGPKSAIPKLQLPAASPPKDEGGIKPFQATEAPSERRSLGNVSAIPIRPLITHRRHPRSRPKPVHCEVCEPFANAPPCLAEHAAERVQPGDHDAFAGGGWSSGTALWIADRSSATAQV